MSLDINVTVARTEDLFNTLNQAISWAYQASGSWQPNPEDEKEVQIYSDMVDYLVFYIRRRFSQMTLVDVKEAIELGAVGDYGQFKGINQKNIVMFIAGHCNTEEFKKLVKKRIILHQPMSSTEPTPAERFNTGKQLVLEGYAAFIAGSPIERTLSLNYDFLDKLGLITYTPAEKQEIYAQAIPAVVAERAETKQRQNGIRDLIKNFNLVPDKGTPDHAEIVSKAKGLTCLKYFGDLKLSGTSLPELLDSKKDLFLSLNK